MKVAVISTELFVLKSARKIAYHENWEIVHVGDITSLNYILKDQQSYFNGIVWHLKDLDFEEVKQFRNFKKGLKNIPTMVLFEHSINKQQTEVEFLKKNSTMFFDIYMDQQVSEYFDCFYNYMIQLNRHDTNSKNIINIYPNISLNIDMRYLNNNGKILPLAGKEFEMLMFFIDTRDRFVTTEEILLAIWDEYTTNETVRQYIYKLRKKLYTNQKNFNLLIHRKSIGYTLIGEGNEFLVGL
ncbi:MULTISPECIES: helix-turn-helix domain-containing protein [unclassified Bacillus (in: firmicutes)]|uniref:winged helix-turn-helix domain-containing protein n=1 Tax=unclassified Bacillus (in: firmicutes) TaxID=185979 RepID=UPI000698DB54|nr:MULTISPECIES: helix-turn-helix domain-containing protein [unclassified Bacillus (in: firmicutes)]